MLKSVSKLEIWVLAHEAIQKLTYVCGICVRQAVRYCHLVGQMICKKVSQSDQRQWTIDHKLCSIVYGLHLHLMHTCLICLANHGRCHDLLSKSSAGVVQLKLFSLFPV
jgi:hypothetical protein